MSPVPLPRTLVHGAPQEKGRDVFAMQRALQHIGALKPGYLQYVYGPKTIDAVKRFQKHHSIRVDGDYGPGTHKLLQNSMDAYSKWLEVQMLKQLKPNTRNLIVHTGFWYYEHRIAFTYSQARPIPTVFYGIKPPHLPRAMDCSGFFVTCYWVNDVIAKLRGGVNTWTLWAQGRQVEVNAMKPGDAVFYDGPEGSLQHMSLYVGNGRVLSNGHYPMGLYPINMAPGYLRVHGARSYLD